VLTFLSSVLLPMTEITGTFGTDFNLVEYHSWQPFYRMLAGMGLMALGVLPFFRLRDWL
jgi:Mg2+ and Co2+ transporter CorA